MDFTPARRAAWRIHAVSGARPELQGAGGSALEKAALIEPLACSLHAVERAHIEFGDVCVIAGAGTLGLGMVACARLKYPGVLVSVDLNEKRLALARTLGADRTLNPASATSCRRSSR